MRSLDVVDHDSFGRGMLLRPMGEGWWIAWFVDRPESDDAPFRVTEKDMTFVARGDAALYRALFGSEVTV